MNKYTYKNLNLQRLMSLGELNIRGIASLNAELGANEYFSKVEDFINKAPTLITTLTEAYETADKAKALEVFETFTAIFNEIGYNKFDENISRITNFLTHSRFEIMKKQISEFLSAFNIFFDKIKVTRIQNRFNVATTPPESDITLEAALELLDNEEETRKLRILAVDDVTVILNTIVSILSPYYEVFALKSASMVEKFLETTTPELFVLDIEMHDINGFDLVPIIRKSDKHKTTPIIFLTGNASYKNIKDAVALGACDFISKPVDRDTLLDKIGKNIVRKKAF